MIKSCTLIRSVFGLLLFLAVSLMLLAPSEAYAFEAKGFGSVGGNTDDTILAWNAPEYREFVYDSEDNASSWFKETPEEVGDVDPDSPTVLPPLGRVGQYSFDGFEVLSLEPLERTDFEVNEDADSPPDESNAEEDVGDDFGQQPENVGCGLEAFEEVIVAQEYNEGEAEYSGDDEKLSQIAGTSTIVSEQADSVKDENVGECSYGVQGFCLYGEKRGPQTDGVEISDSGYLQNPKEQSDGKISQEEEREGFKTGYDGYPPTYMSSVDVQNFPSAAGLPLVALDSFSISVLLPIPYFSIYASVFLESSDIPI